MTDDPVGDIGAAVAAFMASGMLELSDEAQQAVQESIEAGGVLRCQIDIDQHGRYAVRAQVVDGAGSVDLFAVRPNLS